MLKRLITEIANCSYSAEIFNKEHRIQSWFKKKIGQVFDYSCYLDRNQDRILSFQEQELQPHLIYFSHYNQGAVLGKHTTNEIAKRLYSHPIPYQARFEVAGFAFYNLIHFSDIILNSTKSVLDTLLGHHPDQNHYYFPNETIIIAMHIRHMNKVEGGQIWIMILI